MRKDYSDRAAKRGGVTVVMLALALSLALPPQAAGQTIGWDPLDMYFPSVEIGTTVSGVLTLTNTSSSSILEIRDVDLSFNQQQVCDLSLIRFPTGDNPIYLFPTMTLEVTITFTPVDFSFAGCDVVVDSNATNAPTLTYFVMGDGMLPTTMSAVDLMADADGAGTMAVAASFWHDDVGRQYAHMVDPTGGSVMTSVSLTPESVKGVASVGDVNGNGVDDVAVLSVDSLGFVTVKVKEGKDSGGGTHELISKVSFDPAYPPRFMRVLPSIAADGSPDIAVLGVSSTGRPRAQVKDALSGGLAGIVYFESGFNPFGFEVIEDLDGSTYPELAVIGEDLTGRIRAQVKDVVSGALAAPLVWFDRNYRPLHATGMDMDRDGLNDALAVLGRAGAAPGAIVRAQVKDVATASRIGMARYESGYVPKALVSVPHGDGWTWPGLAVLQVAPDLSVRVQIKDPVTGDLLSRFALPQDTTPRGLIPVPDVNGTTSDELAYLGENADGSFLLQIQDAKTGDQVSTVTLPPE